MMAKKTKRAKHDKSLPHIPNAETVKVLRAAKKAWKPTIGAKLGPQEQKLFDFFQRHKITAKVSDLFMEVSELSRNAMWARYNHRQMHQRIGAVVARFNKKRSGVKILPGDLPATYRLKRIR